MTYHYIFTRLMYPKIVVWRLGRGDSLPFILDTASLRVCYRTLEVRHHGTLRLVLVTYLQAHTHPMLHFCLYCQISMHLQG